MPSAFHNQYVLQAEVQHLSLSPPTGSDSEVLCHHYWIPTVTPLVAQSSVWHAYQTCWNSAGAKTRLFLSSAVNKSIKTEN